MAEPPRNSDATRASALAGELRVVLGKLKRRLREQADPGDFTSSQLSVLVRLESEGATTVTALARAEGVRPQSMGATVSVLEAAGFVRGAPDPADGRQTLWSLTAACQKMIKAGRAARQDWLFRAIRANLAPREQAALATGIQLLKRLADSVPNPLVQSPPHGNKISGLRPVPGAPPSKLPAGKQHGYHHP